MLSVGGWLAGLVIETFLLKSPELTFHVPVVSLFFLLPLFVFLYSIAHIVASKFAYKIIFDFDNDTIESFIFHKKPTTKKISELEFVKLNWHTIFKYKSSKDIRTKANAELIQMLKEKNIKISWSLFAKLFMKNEYREYMA